MKNQIISTKDLPDLPPKLVFVDEEDINTVTLYDARNFVCKTCEMVFKREKWYENRSSSCGKTTKKMSMLKKKHPVQLVLYQVTKWMINFFILLCQVFT